MQNTMNLNETLNQDVQLVIINDKKCSNSISAYNILQCGGKALHVFGSDSHVHWFEEGSKKQGKLPIAELQGVKKMQCNDEIW